MKRPLAVIGFTFFAVNLCFAVLPQAALFGLLAVIFVALIYSAFMRRQPKRTVLQVVCGTALIACGYTALYTALFTLPVQRTTEQAVVVSGSVDSIENSYTDGACNAVLLVDKLDGKTYLSPRRIKVFSVPRCEVGETVTLRAEMHLPTRNERAQSIVLRGNYINEYRSDGHNPSWYFAVKRFQSVCSEAIRRVLPGTSGGILTAMTVGDREYISGTTRQAFQAAGLSHILVVSGLHVSALSGIVFWLLGILLRRRTHGRQISAAASAVLVLFYMFAAGLTPSIIRAGTVMLVVFAAMLFNRQSDTVTSLGLALLLILLFNPFAAANISLLLSFSSTLGVLAANAITKKAAAEKQELIKKHRFVWKLLQALSVTAGVTLATLPVCIAFGLGISLPGFLLNVLVVPLLPLILLCGLAVLLLCAVPPLAAMAKLPGLIAGVLLRFITGAAHLAEQTDLYFYLSGAFAFIAVLCIYAVAGIAYKEKPRRAWAAILACMLFALGIYGALDDNTTRIILTGSSENAAVVVIQREFTAVILRGGYNETPKAQRIMNRYNRRSADVLVILEQPRGNDGEIDALQTVTAENTVNHFTIPLRYGKMYGKKQYNGNVLWLDLQGYIICCSSGRPALQSYGKSDVLISEEAAPQADYALLWYTGREQPDAEKDIFTGTELTVRNGVSTVWKEDDDGGFTME